MKSLQFSYVMKTIFIDEIMEHSFTLKCIPQSDAGQSISVLEFHLIPSVKLSRDLDAFGNLMLYGRVRDGHDLFIVKVSGEVNTFDCPIPEEDEKKTWIFKYFTRLTAAGDKLKDFFNKTKASIDEKMSTQDVAEFLMHQVFLNMHYQPAVTGMSTTAEEAFTIGKGVCQDYAHILLSLLRLGGISARYVVGMMEGEGASHAWVEVYDKGAWYGFDPTNNQRVKDTYIRISHGRDSNDCLVERGIFLGDGNQEKLVGVKVCEINRNI